MTQKQINDVIRESRKRAGLTQEQLAEKLGVSNKTVSKWETGRSYPDLLLVPAISKELGISVTEFFDCDEAKPENTKQLNTEKILKNRRNVIFSICLFLLSPIPTLVGYAFQTYASVLILFSVSMLMIIASLIASIMSVARVHDLCRSSSVDLPALRNFNFHVGLYVFLFYLALSGIMLILASWRSHLFVLEVVVFVSFALVPPALDCLAKKKVINPKNLVFTVVTVILATSSIVLIYTDPIFIMRNNLIFVLIICQALNYLSRLFHKKES